MDFRYQYYIVITSFLIGLWKYKILSDQERIIVLLLFINVAADTIGHEIKLRGQNNIWLYNISSFIEILITFIYFILEYRKDNKRKIIIALCIFYFTIYFINSIFIQGFENFHSYTYVPFALILGIISYILLRNQFTVNSKNTKLFSTKSMFLIANFCYYPIVATIMASYLYFLQSNIGQFVFPLKFVVFLYAIWSILLGIGLWKKKVSK